MKDKIIKDILNIWITYDSAGSLHGGGLERCRVWFQKPRYVYLKDTRDWEDENEQREGIQKFGWMYDPFDGGYKEKQSVSFGHVFGYGEGLPEFVWDKLCKHFGSDNLREWSTIESEGKALACNFLLEIPLTYKF